MCHRWVSDLLSNPLCFSSSHFVMVFLVQQNLFLLKGRKNFMQQSFLLILVHYTFLSPLPFHLLVQRKLVQIQEVI
jgi:hypothetical protein